METVKDYLDHDDVMLRLSADMLYTFANLTLGDPQAAQRTREDVHQCLTQAMQEDAPVNVKSGLPVRILCNQHISSYTAGGRNTVASAVHSVSSNWATIICSKSFST